MKNQKLKEHNKKNYDRRHAAKELRQLTRGESVWIPDMKRYGKIHTHAPFQDSPETLRLRSPNEPSSPPGSPGVSPFRGFPQEETSATGPSTSFYKTCSGQVVKQLKRIDI
ncbi:hypothetical protein PR048_006568 [Dryococelus australis]|uniref:Uncharacterized protein n=1 Tax=Dryococelus australis TaxID=614101 RepID=A0ABQ9IBC4_9NEOP|nr:hypothetical protein PR048_006568 [Dryococelus australis]